MAKPTQECIEQMQRIISRIEAWQAKWRSHTDVGYINSLKSGLIQYVNRLEEEKKK